MISAEPSIPDFSQIPHRTALNQRPWQDHLPGRSVVASLHPVQQQPEASSGKFTAVIADRGEGRIGDPGVDQIVHAHYGNLLRNRNSGFIERRKHAHGDHIVGAADGGGPLRQGGKIFSRPAARFQRKAHLEHQPLIQRNASLGQRIGIARSPTDADDRIRRSAGKADSPVSPPDQRPGGQQGAGVAFAMNGVVGSANIGIQHHPSWP